MRRTLTLLAAVLLAFYLAACVGLYTRQRDMLFPGRQVQVGDSPIGKVPGGEEFTVWTKQGSSDVWLLPPLTPPSDKHAALIFAHGNGELIDDWITALDPFRRWGMTVVLVEYPGYGRGKGEPSQDSIRDAMAMAYDLLAAQPTVDRSRIVGLGQSLGGGAICQLASKRPLAAMILVSTFTSIRSFAHRYFLPGFLVRDPFDNDDVVRGYDGPVLILHGRSDDLIPVAQGEELAQIAKHGTLKRYECGHQCWFEQRAALLADMRAFLSANGIVPAAPSDT